MTSIGSDLLLRLFHHPYPLLGNRMPTVRGGLVALVVGLLLLVHCGINAADDDPDAVADHLSPAAAVNKTDAFGSIIDTNSSSLEQNGAAIVGNEAEEKKRSLAIFFILFVIVLATLVVHILIVSQIHWLPESLAIVILGGVVGLILSYSEHDWSEIEALSPDVFFLILLPPIIFENAYNLNKGYFFSNIWPILTFAILGTAISALVIGLSVYVLGQADLVFELSLPECFAFASMISAVDPVATLAIFQAVKVEGLLYMLVFGESMLNDAVSIVLAATALRHSRPPLNELSSAEGQSVPACLPQLLLLLAGDIETNPGPPRWPCSSCGSSAAKGSIECSLCKAWVHSKLACSNLHSIADYRQTTYKCPTCIATLPIPPLAAPAPPPPPQPPPPPNRSHHLANRNPNCKPLRILQYNCNGVAGKAAEIQEICSRTKADVVLIQESKLSPKSKDPTFAGYSTVRKDRIGKTGGGLLTLVSEALHYHQLPDRSAGQLESLSISLDISNGSPFTIHNIYIPPASSCAQGFIPDLSPFLLSPYPTIIGGDFNAHDPAWHSSNIDARGAIIAEQIDDSDFAALNSNEPTRVPPNGRPTSPDISLASQDLLTHTTWRTSQSGPSDHLPIIIDIKKDQFIHSHRTESYLNIRKTDWQRFTSSIESDLLEDPLPRAPAPIAERHLRRILLKAVASAVPQGRVHKRKSNLSPPIKQMMAQRDQIRETDPDSPDIIELNKSISASIDKEKRTQWRTFIESFDPKTDGAKLWKVIKTLSNKNNAPKNSAIEFKSKSFTSPKEISDNFNKIFTAPVKYTTSPSNRIVRRKIASLPKDDFTPFTPQEVREAIKLTKKSRAIGPDGIAPIMLHFLGPRAIDAITYVINDSLRTSRIPAIWKTSIILPLPKPGKPTSEGTSYRPISLLSPLAKLTERLLLKSLQSHIKPAEHQHGFTKGRSTTTALSIITDSIATGFNMKKPAARTVLAAVDMSKAFDSLNLFLLIDLLISTPCPRFMVKWIAHYLLGRTGRTSFREATSSARRIRTGVPQGSALSPLLFNLYLRDLPISPEVNMVSYADDISLWSSDPLVDIAVNKLQAALTPLQDFLTQRELILAPKKSMGILFTPFSNEFKAKLQLTMAGEHIPTVNSAKILGVTYDTMFTFAGHCRDIAARISKRTNILKALAGSTWGNHSETLRLTYKAIGQSIYGYASPAWSSIASPSSINKIQTAQNAALRAITGTHSIASQGHIHHETKILPVQTHLDMLSAQFLARTLDQKHIKHGSLNAPPPARTMKLTAVQKHKPRIDNIINTINNRSPKKVASAIHTDFVKEALVDVYRPVILGGRPPLHSTERKQTSPAPPDAHSANFDPGIADSQRPTFTGSTLLSPIHAQSADKDRMTSSTYSTAPPNPLALFHLTCGPSRGKWPDF